MPVEDLIADLLSEDDALRKSAESSLNELSAETVLSEISALLRSPDKCIRNRGMELFCFIGSDAVSSLGELLTDDEWTVRYRAAEALGIIGGDVASCEIYGCKRAGDLLIFGFRRNGGFSSNR